MNPIILYASRFLDGTPTATDTASGYNVLNIIDYKTYTLWKAASVGTKYITVDCGSDKSADALGIISHNLYTANATISVESSTDNFAANVTERLAGFIPTSNNAFLKPFTSATDRYWRIKIVTAAVVPYLAIAMLGEKLLFPYAPDVPYIPYSEGIEVESSKSKGGNLLGSIVQYKPIEISARFSTLTRTWVINTFKPFWDNHASDLKPFFYVWDNDIYPQFCFWVKAKDSSKYQMPVTILDYVDSIELEMEGIKE